MSTIFHYSNVKSRLQCMTWKTALWAQRDIINLNINIKASNRINSLNDFWVKVRFLETFLIHLRKHHLRDFLIFERKQSGDQNKNIISNSWLRCRSYSTMQTQFQFKFQKTGSSIHQNSLLEILQTIWNIICQTKTITGRVTKNHFKQIILPMKHNLFEINLPFRPLPLRSLGTGTRLWGTGWVTACLVWGNAEVFRLLSWTSAWWIAIVDIASFLKSTAFGVVAFQCLVLFVALIERE